MTDRAGDVIWRLSRELLRDSEYAAFVRWLTETGRAAFGEAPAYRDVWQWSVDDVGRFWQAFAEYTGVAGAASQPGAPAAMPGRGWFPGTGVNYAARCLAGDRQGPAIVAIDDDGTRHVTTWEQLRRQVGALAGFLRDSGIAPGDRVAAVLPNRTEAVVGLLRGGLRRRRVVGSSARIRRGSRRLPPGPARPGRAHRRERLRLRRPPHRPDRRARRGARRAPRPAAADLGRPAGRRPEDRRGGLRLV